VHLNITDLPEKYFIDRWRPKEKKQIRHVENQIPRELTGENNQLRFNILSRRLIDLASDGSKTPEKYMYLLRQIEKIESEMASIEPVLEKNMQSETTTGKNDPSTYATTHLKDPDVGKPKGRPENNQKHYRPEGRMKPMVEIFKTKQIITCGHCREHDHNIQRCPNLHLDKVQKMKKKNPKAKATGNN
jgi:hypothetical protein